MEILRELIPDQDGYYETCSIYVAMLNEGTFEGTLKEFHQWLRKNNWIFKLEKNRKKKWKGSTYNSNLAKPDNKNLVSTNQTIVKKNIILDPTIKEYIKEFLNNFELYCEYTFSNGKEPLNEKTFKDSTKKIRY